MILILSYIVIYLFYTINIKLLKNSIPLKIADQISNHYGKIFMTDFQIINAGLVLVSPYIQRLFSILELTRDGIFIDEQASERGVYLLQYIVSGEKENSEQHLQLNKLLCGIHGDFNITTSITISSKEKEIIEQMLQGVIQHWSAIGKTSIKGLRETFLQRDGDLFYKENNWQLKIPQSTFDMLLDRLPWSFSLIKFPWMNEPLHVTWR